MPLVTDDRQFAEKENKHFFSRIPTNQLTRSTTKSINFRPVFFELFVKTA